MHQVTELKAGSRLVGELPKGCIFCGRGSKMVLFVTGRCDYGCYYCPISEKRRGGGTWANERPIASDNQVLDEASRMVAEGASLTGGEPLLEIEKCLHYIRLLKENFSPRFHIHMYTYGALATASTLSKLNNAGLDELRFHSNFQNLESALAYGWGVGAEVPAIPGQTTALKSLVDRLDGKAFLNLNELEFSATNTNALFSRGFESRDELSYGVKGSEEAAAEVLEYAKEKDISAHYCSSKFKDSVQYRARLTRTANNIHKPYEKIIPDGLLLKGVISGPDLPALHARLLKQFSLSPDYLQIDTQKNRLETSVAIAERIAKKAKDLKIAIVREFPTSDRYEAEYYPLGEDNK